MQTKHRWGKLETFICRFEDSPITLINLKDYMFPSAAWRLKKFTIENILLWSKENRWKLQQFFVSLKYIHDSSIYQLN